MYEYEIKNLKTGETDFLYGYSWNNAVKRAKKNNPVWNDKDYAVVRAVYVD